LAVGVEGRQWVANHVANVMGDKRDFLNFQLVENAGEITRLRSFLVSALRVRRQAHAT